MDKNNNKVAIDRMWMERTLNFNNAVVCNDYMHVHRLRGTRTERLRGSAKLFPNLSYHAVFNFSKTWTAAQMQQPSVSTSIGTSVGASVVPLHGRVDLAGHRLQWQSDEDTGVCKNGC